MKANKIKLLELCTSPSQGGLELYYAQICNALRAYFVLTCAVGKKSSVRTRLQQGHDIRVLHKKAHYFPVITAVKLAKLIDEQGIQVIHLHWNKDLTLAVLAKLISHHKPKIILTRHMQFPSRKDSILHRFLYKHVDHIIAVSQTMANDLKRFIPEDVQPEISVNYLGVDILEPLSDIDIAQVRQRYDPKKKLFLIGLFGRIDPYKGHDLFIDALRMAKAEGKPFKGLIVGHAKEVSYLKHLQRRVVEHQLEKYITFTGFVDQPRMLMQACDTVVLTSVEETFGLVLIEAMSVGIPVIGSDRGGVPEIITHQETGLLFKSEDSMALYAALDVFYQDTGVAKLYAKNALVKVQSVFNIKEHVIRLVQLLDTIKKVRHE